MLQNRSFVQLRPGGSPPFSLINSEPPGSARSSPGCGARRSQSLDGEDRAVQSRARCGGGAAFDPGFGFFDFVSTGSAAPTTCKSSTCLTTCNSEGLSTNSRPD